MLLLVWLALLVIGICAGTEGSRVLRRLCHQRRRRLRWLQLLRQPLLRWRWLRHVMHMLQCKKQL